VHSVIKPDNLLISEDDVLKIADFGISNFYEDDNDYINNENGTKYFMAPEMWTDTEYRVLIFFSP